MSLRRGPAGSEAAVPCPCVGVQLGQRLRLPLQLLVVIASDGLVRIY